MPDPAGALIVGLGNPGKEYAAHRHNVGFRVVDALAGSHGLVFARDKYAQARLARGRIAGSAVLLVKPQTFMNLSGRAVARLARRSVIPPDCLLVVYDDLDLPLGRLRLRPEGGSGGHKGMRSIIDHLGTQGFARLRVGIDRPPAHMDPADYVLQPFAPEERPILAEVLALAVDAIEVWLQAGIAAAMDRFNQPLALETGEPSLPGQRAMRAGLGGVSRPKHEGSVRTEHQRSPGEPPTSGDHQVPGEPVVEQQP